MKNRIVLGSSDEVCRHTIKRVLLQEGYSIVADTGDYSSLLRFIRATQPDLVIIDIDLKGQSGLEAAKIISQEKIAPVILIAQGTTHSIMESVAENYVFAFLIKPIVDTAVLATITSALANHHKYTLLEKKVDKLKEDLAARKFIEKAKYLLMEQLSISEPEAFRKMQKQSMDKGLPMKSIAEAIILANEFRK